MSRSSTAHDRGFTLIELMMVVAIIGILASVAIPAFRLMTYRSKTAERSSVIRGIKNSVNALWAKDGTFGGGTVVSAWNPGLPATPVDAMQRRQFNPTVGAWSKLDLVVDGTLYYSYRFTTQETANPYYFTVEVQGDIDGNGEDYYYLHEWEEDTTGAFRQVTDDPDFVTESMVF